MSKMIPIKTAKGAFFRERKAARATFSTFPPSPKRGKKSNHTASTDISITPIAPRMFARPGCWRDLGRLGSLGEDTHLSVCEFPKFTSSFVEEPGNHQEGVVNTLVIPHRWGYFCQNPKKQPPYMAFLTLSIKFFELIKS